MCTKELVPGLFVAPNYELVQRILMYGFDGGTLCYMDILVKKDNLWYAYEGKASTGLKDYHIMDASF